MLVGHKDKGKIFKRLLKEDTLAHGYLFFGEEQTGKKTFALSLANFIEKGSFEEPAGILSECRVFSPDSTSIGIDEMRKAKQFLSQKAVLAPKRTLIVDDAHKLTTDAQNAILKLTEEPPENSLIILISPTLDALLSTLGSRLQRIYFPRVSTKEIESFLKGEAKLSATEATRIAKLALGRPGRAMRMLEDPVFERFAKIAKDFIKTRSNRKETIKTLMKENDESDDSNLIDLFVSHIMAELAVEPVVNQETLSALCDRFTKMSDFSTNRRLQLETALWNL
jgi:DNA polymerase III subunit delta'